MNQLKEEELVAQRARELREDSLDECLECLLAMAERLASLATFEPGFVEVLRAQVRASIDAHTTEKEAAQKIKAILEHEP